MRLIRHPVIFIKNIIDICGAKLNFLRYFFILTCACILLLVAAAAFNYKIDPAHLFSDKEHEKAIARILLQGSNVAVPPGQYYDDRLVQEYYIKGLTQGIDVLVFGSSRCLYIRSSMFRGKTFFNHWVSLSGIEDYMAIYEMHRRRGFNPSVVVLGIDQWVFTKRDSAKIGRMRSIESSYQDAMKRLKIEEERKISVGSYLYAELISLSYLKSSIIVWYQDMKRVRATRYFLTNEKASELYYIQRADGSSNDLMKKSTRQQVIAKAEGWGTTSREEEKSISLGKFEEFRYFVNALKKDGVKVIIFLPPYHPVTYGKLMERNARENIQLVQKYLVDIADKEKIDILGSYDPIKSGCDESDFRDGIHLTEEGTKKIFRIIDH